MIISVTTQWLLAAGIYLYGDNSIGGYMEYAASPIRVSSTSRLLQVHHLYTICKKNRVESAYPLFKLTRRAGSFGRVYREDNCTSQCYDVYLECKVFPFSLDNNSRDVRLSFNSTLSAVCFTKPLSFIKASQLCSVFKLPASNVELIPGGFGSSTDSWMIEDNCSSLLPQKCFSIRRMTENFCAQEDLVAINCRRLVPVARLLDWGGGGHRGPVQMQFGDEWREVCSASFSLNDAAVVCRSLHYNSSDANYHLRRYNVIGRENHPGEFKCSGSELALKDCPGLQPEYEFCASSYGIELSCDQAFEGKVRLSGGYDGLSGRLELYHNGAWGTVCKDSFGSFEMNTACKQLTGDPKRTGTAIQSKTVLPSTTVDDIVLGGVNCGWSDNNLLDCIHSPLGEHRCRGNNIVYLSCSEEPKFRLAGGDGSYGRLEVYHDSQWGTVCNRSFDISLAAAACTTMNFTSTVARLGGAKPMPGAGRLWLDRITCREAHNLKDCTHDPWGEIDYKCSHDYDVQMSCETTDKNAARLSLEGVPHSKDVGKLNIYYEMSGLSITGAICMREPSHAVAIVGCRTLGLPTKDASLLGKDVFTRYYRTAVLFDVVCTGNEPHILDCAFRPMHRSRTNEYCVDNNIVILACGASSLPEYSLRLTTSDREPNITGTRTRGLLEVLRHGVWGAVADNGFTNKEAEVACRELGLPTVSAVVDTTLWSRTQVTWLTDVDCTGSETRLQRCSFSADTMPYTYGGPVTINCKSDASEVPVYVFICSALGAVLGIILVVVLCCWLKRRKKSRPPAQPARPRVQRNTEDIPEYPLTARQPTAPIFHTDPPYTPPVAMTEIPDRPPASAPFLDPPPSYAELFPGKSDDSTV